MTINKWLQRLKLPSAIVGITTAAIIIYPSISLSFSSPVYQIAQIKNTPVSLTLEEAIKRGLCKDTKLKAALVNNSDGETIANKIRFDITIAYYDSQEADVLSAIKQATVADASQSLRDTRLLEQAGLGTQADVSRGETELSIASEQLTEAIANQRLARLKLAAILKESNIEPIAADELQQAGPWSLSSDEIEQILYQKWADSQQNAREIDESSLRDEAIRKNDEASRQLKEKIREREIAIEVNTAYAQLSIKQKKIEIARLNVEIASELLRLNRLYFQAGTDDLKSLIVAQEELEAIRDDFESLIIAQTKLETARTDYLKAIMDYNRAYNDLQWTVGYQKSSPSDTYFQELIQKRSLSPICSNN